MLDPSPFATSTPPALATMIHMLGCSTNKSDAAEVVDGDDGGWIRSLPFFYSDCLTTLQSHCRPAFWTGTSDNPVGPRMLAVSMFCSDQTSEDDGRRDPRERKQDAVVDKGSEENQGDGSLARSRSNKSKRRRPERSKSSPHPQRAALKTDTARNWSQQGRENSTATPTPSATPTPRLIQTRSVELRKLGDLASTWLDSVAAEEETVLSRVDNWLASTHGTLCSDSRCNCVDTEFLMATHVFGSPHAETQASSSIECGWDAFIESDRLETIWGDADWDADDEMSSSGDTGRNVRICRKLFATSQASSVRSPQKTDVESCLDIAEGKTEGGDTEITRIEIASSSCSSESDGVDFMKENHHHHHHHQPHPQDERKIDGGQEPSLQGVGKKKRDQAKASRRFGWLVMSCCRGGGRSSVFSEEESLQQQQRRDDDCNTLCGRKKKKKTKQKKEKKKQG
ncbi:hypothetical protein BSKO_12440 [Bryopsis sp. KO-2023]|nr:hypothetical protein BSKO_12440 [Bryopsis sp. KO-2023]